tara:strand:- start:850 stop:2163 length:1314 start_codon:yes stop_codon:yes gene_type:complete
MNLQESSLNIGKALRHLSLHNFIGLSSIFVLGLIDMFFLALSSEMDFAIAVFTSPFIFILISFFVGLSTAKMIYFSKKINEGFQLLNAKSHYIDIFATLIFLAIIIPLYIYINKILLLFNAPKDLYELSITYIHIHYIGIIFCIWNILKSSYLRAIGNSKLASRVILISSLVNALLDPLFIFYFDMGANGAAISTMIAWVLSFIYMNHRYYYKLKNKLEIVKTNIWSFYKITPSFVISQILTELSIIIIMFFIGKIGIDAISGVGFGVRLESLILLISAAFCSAFSVFIGQNVNDKERCRSAYKIILSNSLLTVFVSSVLLYFSVDLLSIMFELNDNAAEILSLYLLFNIVFSIFNTVYFINGAYLNVVDAHNKVLWSNIIKTFILLPLFAYFLESKFGYEGVLVSLLLLSVIANIIQLLMTRKEYKVLLEKNKQID